MATKFVLPVKIPSYLRRLNIEYARARERLLSEIVRGGRIIAVEGVASDWGNAGHDVILFLPPETLQKLALGEQQDVADRIRADLNECAKGTRGEFINGVIFDLNDEADPRFQAATPFSGTVPPNPDTLAIWKPGFLRLFVSHRDAYKVQARQLSLAMETYGVSCFVAHDTIEPMSSWQLEVEKALQTMEVMLAFVTDDFHDSEWTDQEVGFALGRGVPVIGLKLGKIAPRGFIAATQALRGSLEHPERAAKDLYPIIAEKLGHRERLNQTLIASFVATPDWSEATVRFQRMAEHITSLTDDEFNQIKAGFEANDQLHLAAYLVNSAQRFRKFLERARGRKYVINARGIAPVLEEEIPF